MTAVSWRSWLTSRALLEPECSGEHCLGAAGTAVLPEWGQPPLLPLTARAKSSQTQEHWSSGGLSYPNSRPLGQG